MKKRPTNIEQVRRAMAEMDAQICAFTGLSQEELEQIRFECAFTYLEKVIGTDSHGLELIPREPGFWGWWRRDWYRVDELLMEEVRFDTRMMVYFLEITSPLAPSRGGDCNELALTSAARWREAWEVFHSPDPANYRVTNFPGWHKMMKSIITK